MNSLRIEAEESQAKVEELQAQVKRLEQESLAKEQEITSLTHKNRMLTEEVEKLEGGIKEAKATADESLQHGRQSETMQRRLQLLEEEAEEADKNLRDLNDKYVTQLCVPLAYLTMDAGFGKQTSRLVITNVKSKHWRRIGTSGSRSTKRWPRNMQTYRKSWTSFRGRWEVFEGERAGPCRRLGCYLWSLLLCEHMSISHNITARQLLVASFLPGAS